MRYTLTLGSLLSVIFALAGAFQPSTAAAIVGGEDDTSGQFAHVGHIVVRNDSTGELLPNGTGVLVGPNALLTAAHVVDAPGWFGAEVGNGWTFYVTFDESVPVFDMTVPTTMLVPVTAVVAHPSYAANRSSGDQGGDSVIDLAVFVLGEAQTSQTPATMPECGFLDGLSQGQLTRAAYTVVGYGATGWEQGMLEIPNPGIRTSGFPAFQTVTPGYLRLRQNESQGYSGTCNGDSGGPAFISIGGEQVLAGILSTGDAYCVATSAETRIDTPAAQSWLDEVNATYGTAIPTDC